MKSLLGALLLFVISSNSYYQKAILLDDVSKHISDSFSVCGKVSSVRFLETAKYNPTFIKPD